MNIKKKIHEEFNWEKIVQLVDSQPPEKDMDGNYIKIIYLGSVFNIMPSGKYYMPWACSNVTEEEMWEDQQYMEALEDVASEYGLFITASEGDPTDLLIGKVVDIENDGEAA